MNKYNQYNLEFGERLREAIKIQYGSQAQFARILSPKINLSYLGTKIYIHDIVNLTIYGTTSGTGRKKPKWAQRLAITLSELAFEEDSDLIRRVREKIPHFQYPPIN